MQNWNEDDHEKEDHIITTRRMATRKSRQHCRPPPLSSPFVGVGSASTRLRMITCIKIVVFVTIASVSPPHLLLCHGFLSTTSTPTPTYYYTWRRPPLSTTIQSYPSCSQALGASFSSDAEDSASPEDSDESSSSLLLRQKKRELTKEFLTIGGPALIQLAAEPLAALVDTAYLGRLGPEVLGGAGVAITAQYAVSKLYNDPLLRTSISLVASQDGMTRAKKSGKEQKEGDDTNSTEEDDTESSKQLSIAVSSALLLAATVGLIQLVVYATFCKTISINMGVAPTSKMWYSCVSYLQIRAYGTPAATLWLVTNGIFRGLGDTRTPLIYSLLFTSLNAVLDPLFIFVFHWGASGAAMGTALAQYIALVPLLLALNRRVRIDVFGQLSALGDSLKQYLRAGGLILFRTVGKVLAYTVCSRQAALLGDVSAAAYNLTFQLGFATTQICEAVAVAVQTLMAREIAETTATRNTATGNSGESYSPSSSPAFRASVLKHLINTSVFCGGGIAALLSLVTYLRRDMVVKGLTTNLDVQRVASGIFIPLLATQMFKGLAYPVNGIIMGGLDWTFSMCTTWLAAIISVCMLRAFGSGATPPTLGQIWWALAAFMAVQCVMGVLRYQSRTGVWSVLKSPESEAKEA